LVSWGAFPAVGKRVCGIELLRGEVVWAEVGTGQGVELLSGGADGICELESGEGCLDGCDFVLGWLWFGGCDVWPGGVGGDLSGFGAVEEEPEEGARSPASDAVEVIGEVAWALVGVSPVA